MVLFFTSPSTDPPSTIYMGRDKFENEVLLRYAFPSQDVWFHVDKFSSAHVYLRLPLPADQASSGSGSGSGNTMTWDKIPQSLLDQMGQLTKANSIMGNKKKNVTIIYTPCENIKKTGDMDVGTVSFHNERLVKRFLVKDRENEVVNMLNRTKREVEVDHEAVRIQRERERGKEKKEKAREFEQAKAAETKRRQEERQAKDYSSLYSSEAIERDRREKQIAADRARRIKEESGQATQGQEDEGGESDTGSAGSFM